MEKRKSWKRDTTDDDEWNLTKDGKDIFQKQQQQAEAVEAKVEADNGLFE